MAVSRLAGLSLTVPDLAAAVRFYGEAFGFVVEVGEAVYPDDYAALLGVPERRIRGTALRLGRQHLEVLAFDPPGRPYPEDSTASDLWFQHCAIVVSDMAAAYARVAQFATAPITQGGPQRLPPNTGAVTAWKFRDPFGHPLELLHLPDGVGHPDWHRPKPPLFQGIDHTAIAVSDAAAAASFYRRLGFAESSRTHNQGPEQSRLDGFPDVDVDVLGLSPDGEPPHLELLAYRTGRRRPRPATWTSADVGVSRTLLDIRSGLGDDEPFDATARLKVDPDGHLVVVRGSSAAGAAPTSAEQRGLP